MTGEEKLQGCNAGIVSLASFLNQAYGNVIITSGYRNDSDNNRVGGKKGSAHLIGAAIDVVVPHVDPVKVCALVLNNILKYPIKAYGLDVYRNMCHFDNMDREVSTIVKWVYNKNGEVV